MKHAKQHLDQFFEAARTEAPLMSDTEFDQLVQSLPEPVTPDTFSLSPTRRIATAFKQPGGFVMTGLGLTAITGLMITGYLLNTPEGTTPSTTPQPRIESYASVGSENLPPASEQRVSSVVDETKEPRGKRTTVVATPRRDSSLWSKIDVTEIKPLVPSPEAIAELGVQIEPNGRVELQHRTPGGGLTLRMPFPPPGIPRHGDHMIVNDPKGPIAEVMPTMVTDAKGRKLAFFFQMDSIGDGFHAMSAMAISRTDDEGEALDHPGIPPMPEITYELENLDKNMPLFDIEIPKMDIQIEGLEGKDGNQESIEVNVEASDDAKGKPMIKIRRNGGRFDSSIAHSAYAFAFSDSARRFFKQAPGAIRSYELLNDSSFYRNKFLNMDGKKRVAIEMQINGDTLHGFAPRMAHRFTIDSSMNFYKHFANMDSMGKHVEKIRHLIENRKIIRRNGWPREGTVDIMKHHGGQHPPIQVVADFRAQMEKINKLVPVQIRPTDPLAEFNKMGLIFWYAPDEKFLNAAPATLRDEVVKVVAERDGTLPAKPASSSTPQTSAAAQAMVYPNPTTSDASLHYTLSEPRAVSIAIYDLMGKQLVEVCREAHRSAGELEEGLDLRGLPEGVYLVVLVTDKGEQLSTRLVIGQ